MAPNNRINLAAAALVAVFATFVYGWTAFAQYTPPASVTPTYTYQLAETGTLANTSTYVMQVAAGKAGTITKITATCAQFPTKGGEVTVLFTKPDGTILTFANPYDLSDGSEVSKTSVDVPLSATPGATHLLVDDGVNAVITTTTQTVPTIAPEFTLDFQPD